MNSDEAARSEERRHAAYHEAGHAVVAIAEGFAVGCLSIRQELDGSLNAHTHTNFSMPERLLGPLEAKVVELLKAAIVVALAGNIAEEMLLGAVRPSRGVSKEREHDEFTAQKLLSIVQPWHSAVLGRICGSRASSLINERRADVKGLAEKLLAVDSIVGAAIDNKVGKHPPCYSCATNSKMQP